jgi:hypothetical protein
MMLPLHINHMDLGITQSHLSHPLVMLGLTHSRLEGRRSILATSHSMLLHLGNDPADLGSDLAAIHRKLS